MAKQILLASISMNERIWMQRGSEYFVIFIITVVDSRKQKKMLKIPGTVVVNGECHGLDFCSSSKRRKFEEYWTLIFILVNASSGFFSRIFWYFSGTAIYRFQKNWSIWLRIFGTSQKRQLNPNMRQYRPIVSRKRSPNKLSDPRGMKSKILFISILSEK